jgi:hypothetical protein
LQRSLPQTALHQTRPLPNQSIKSFTLNASSVKTLGNGNVEAALGESGAGVEIAAVSTADEDDEEDIIEVSQSQRGSVTQDVSAPRDGSRVSEIAEC